VAVKRGNSTPFSPSPPGGTSRRGILRTLRLSEARSGDSEGPESTLGHPFVCVPGAIAGEVHVLPAEGESHPCVLVLAPHWRLEISRARASAADMLTRQRSHLSNVDIVARVSVAGSGNLGFSARIICLAYPRTRGELGSQSPSDRHDGGWAFQERRISALERGPASSFKGCTENR